MANETETHQDMEVFEIWVYRCMNSQFNNLLSVNRKFENHNWGKIL